MALDPRRFLVANCSKDANSRIKRNTEKKGLLDAARFAGGIEGLDDVGEGLRALVSTSDVIAGGGTNPYAGLSTEAGGNIVMAEVAINPRAIRENALLSPDVVNRGVGAAEQIFDKVDAGEYSDITDLPQAAADLTNLKKFADKIFTTSDNVSQPDVVRCQASPYAIDLIKRAPKNKFMFVVQFNFSNAYNIFGQRLDTFAFVVKQADRPTVAFDYEDVNLYNYKTKAIKRSTYNPLNMRFYDDDLNEGMQFYNSYLRAMVPNANMNKNQQELLEESGLAYEQLNQGAALGVPTHAYSASAGPLLNNEKTVLKEITLYHVFGNGHLVNVYRFLSPKILELQLDELNMAESGDGNEIAINYSFDGLYIEPNQSLDPAKNPEISIENRTRGGQYPLHYIGPGVQSQDDTKFGSDDIENTDPNDLPPSLRF